LALRSWSDLEEGRKQRYLELQATNIDLAHAVSAIDSDQSLCVSMHGVSQGAAI
jgi:hypothetical protein